MPGADDLCRVTNLLRHRGPDSGGYWHERGIFFGHRRLSIIDIATGEQPMATADGRYVITFNGEIYNYPELRDELREAGATFRTASDTEVILAGYAVWGMDVVSRLEGMFAFALYDRFDRTLLLARDRFGEKPLLVSERDGRVAFASELAPLAIAGIGGREIDVEALGGYLCLNYVPGTRTMLRDVRRVAPAECRLYGPEGLRAQAHYWSAAATRPSSGDAPDDEILDHLQERLDHAARITLRSDVPVGLFLSGGVDSSVVAHSAARIGRLDTAFCVDMATQGFSEWSGASAVARRLDIDLVRVPLDVSVLGEFLDVTRHLDDPLADSSAMAVWTIARAAGRRLKVVLSGDGGDELFGGYLTYPASAWHHRIRAMLPTAVWQAVAQLVTRLGVNDRVKVGRGYKLQRFMRALPLETREAHFTWNGTWLPEQAVALSSDSRLREAAAQALRRLADSSGLGASVSVHDLQISDIREYLANDILAKVDRATMAHGLESRAPLLNPGVAAAALSLPVRLRIGARGSTKIALRKLCARHFGRAHAYAPKQGFSIPVHTWLRHEGRSLMTSLLAPERVDAIGLLDSRAITHAMRQHLSGARAYGWELWGLMVLVAWHDERVSRPPEIRRLPDPSDLRRVVPATALSHRTGS
jgi:asparagine synthase (glutamine-hydrolysing)